MNATDKRFKKWVINTGYAILAAMLSYFFRDFLLTKVCIPLFMLPLLIIFSIFLSFYLRHLIFSLSKAKNLKFMRRVLLPGRRFGVAGGDPNLTVVEWSWLNPNIILAVNQQGQEIRVHASIAILYT